MDCGATCLRMVAKQYGREYSINRLRRICETGKQGVSLYAISHAAEQIGFNTLGVKIKMEDLREAPLPCILHWRNTHFVVLHQIHPKSIIHNPKSIIHHPKSIIQNPKFTIADPATDGIMKIDAETFRQCWIGDAGNEGVA